jgi:hypothetical protein
VSGRWVRRLGAPALVAALGLLLAGCVTFTGTKEVTGGESDGPFVVEISCPGALGSESEELIFEGAETVSSSEFEFDAGTYTCTIVETDDAGATSVAYECGDITASPFELPPDMLSEPAEDEGNAPPSAGGGPGMSVRARGDGPFATCAATEEGITVDLNLFAPVELGIAFTVINDFPPTPTTTTALPPAPAAALPAAGQPTFTG